MSEIDMAPVTWRGNVLHEWVDFNGHLRDAFYLLLFSMASDNWMEVIGLDEAGRAATGHSLFTLEAHVNYLLEVREGVAVEVRTQLLGHDAKRLHLYHRLHRADDPTLLAGSEQMLLNVDMSLRRSAPFAASVLPRLQALAAQQRSLPVPKFAGRSIALPA